MSIENPFNNLPQETPEPPTEAKIEQEQNPHEQFSALTDKLNQAKAQLDAVPWEVANGEMTSEERERIVAAQRENKAAYDVWFKLKHERIDLLKSNPELFDELAKARLRAAIEASQAIGVPPEETFRNVDVLEDLDKFAVRARPSEDEVEEWKKKGVDFKSIYQLEQEVLRDFQASQQKEQLGVEKSRTISDAEFLKDGAEYKLDEGGQKYLEVTEAQIEDAKQEMESELANRELEADRPEEPSEKMAYYDQDLSGFTESLKTEIAARLEEDKEAEKIEIKEPQPMMFVGEKGEKSRLCVVTAEDENYYYGNWEDIPNMGKRFPKEKIRALSKEETAELKGKRFMALYFDPKKRWKKIEKGGK
ncbi:hypothetical protein L0Y69_00850 [bacterium]|nr:hypothetical protein [bacterium]